MNAYRDSLRSMGDSSNSSGSNSCPRRSPNARFQLIISTPRQYFDDGKVDSFEVRFKASSSNTTADWSRCTKIETVKFSGEVSSADLRAFFGTKKPHLRIIYFRTGTDTEDRDEIIKLIADGTGALERLKMGSRIPSVGVLDELVRNNQQLASVGFYSFDPLPVDEIVDILESFLQSPALEHMQLHDGRPNIGTARPKAVWHAHRFRRVYIEVTSEPLLR